MLEVLCLLIAVALIISHCLGHQAATVKSKAGDMPLHLALELNVTHELVCAVLKAAPEVNGDMRM